MRGRHTRLPAQRHLVEPDPSLVTHRTGEHRKGLAAWLKTVNG